MLIHKNIFFQQLRFELPLEKKHLEAVNSEMNTMDPFNKHLGDPPKIALLKPILFSLN